MRTVLHVPAVRLVTGNGYTCCKKQNDSRHFVSLTAPPLPRPAPLSHYQLPWRFQLLYSADIESSGKGATFLWCLFNTFPLLAKFFLSGTVLRIPPKANRRLIACTRCCLLFANVGHVVIFARKPTAVLHARLDPAQFNRQHTLL